MAERLIRESDILKNIDEWLETVGYATIGKNLSYYAELKGCIADATTVEAKPVVHAHWALFGKDGTDTDYGCTNCGYTFTTSGSYPQSVHYCPYCGAQMDEGGE